MKKFGLHLHNAYFTSQRFVIIVTMIVMTRFCARAVSSSTLSRTLEETSQTIDTKIVKLQKNILRDAITMTQTLQNTQYYDVIAGLSMLDTDDLTTLLQQQINDTREDLIKQTNELHTAIQDQEDLHDVELITDAAYNDALFDISIDIDGLERKFDNKISTLSGSMQQDIRDFQTRINKFQENNATRIDAVYDRATVIHEIMDARTEIQALTTAIESDITAVDFGALKQRVQSQMPSIRNEINTIVANRVQMYPSLTSYNTDIAKYTDTLYNDFERSLLDAYNILVSDIYPAGDIEALESLHMTLTPYIQYNNNNEYSIDYAQLENASLSRLHDIRDEYIRVVAHMNDIVRDYNSVSKDTFMEEFAPRVTQLYEDTRDDTIEQLNSYLAQKIELLGYKIEDQRSLYDACIAADKALTADSTYPQYRINNVFEQCYDTAIVLVDPTQRMSAYRAMVNARTIELDREAQEGQYAMYYTQYNDYKTALRALLISQYESALSNNTLDDFYGMLTKLDGFADKRTTFASAQSRFILIALKTQLLQFGYLTHDEFRSYITL